MKAMIMAAGRGERMRPLTDSCPKPLLQVGGKALLDYHIEALVAAGFKEIVINAAWLADSIVNHVGSGRRFGARIELSLEAEPLESGGGLVHALPLLGAAPFVAVNGDTYCDYDYRQLHRFELGDNLAHLVLVDNPQHNPEGDFGLAGGKVLSSAPRYTFSGIRVFSPKIVAHRRAEFFSVVPLLKKAIAEGKVSGEYFSGQWHDIGTPERLKMLDIQLSSS